MAKTMVVNIELTPSKSVEYSAGRMVPVDSSNIECVGKAYIHDSKNRKELPALLVKFKGKGILYIYEGITPELFRKFDEHASKGKALNEFIIPNASETYKLFIG